MKKTLIIITSILLLVSCTHHESDIFYIEGVSSPQINLNGTWKINTNPPEEFWTLNTLNKEWIEIQVPGECAMQGISIKHDIPFVYRKNIDIPKDYKNKLIKIQFEGVYSYARVWVNGKYVRDHSGGFTKWICDITPFVEPGETLEDTVIREIREEVNVDVCDIAYIGSQPWPFPHSLMIGFTTRYAGGDIQIDNNEIEDAQWFSIDNLPVLPTRISIAHHLIQLFIKTAR